MIFFLGSLEMSAPILSGWKRRRMRKREGGLKRISEGGREGEEVEREGGGGVFAAEIHAAL